MKVGIPAGPRAPGPSVDPAVILPRGNVVACLYSSTHLNWEPEHLLFCCSVKDTSRERGNEPRAASLLAFGGVWGQ